MIEQPHLSEQPRLTEPVKVAYADPPYIGQARRHYADHADYAGEVDHQALIQRLVEEFPDGWALSCSVPSLRVLLAMCPADVRIGAWVKPFHVLKRNVRPSSGWEPVLFRGGRNPPAHRHLPPPKGGRATTPRDFVVCEDPAVVENVTLRRGLVGVKPERVCHWIFDVLGLRPGDDLHDLFPGSGAVTRAWQTWQAARSAALEVG